MQNLCDQLAQVACSVSQARPSRPPEPISGTRQTQHTRTHRIPVYQARSKHHALPGQRHARSDIALRASGNYATNSPALEAQRVDIRATPPIPQKGRTYANSVCVLRSHESLSSCSEHLKSFGTLSHSPDSFDQISPVPIGQKMLPRTFQIA